MDNFKRYMVEWNIPKLRDNLYIDISDSQSNIKQLFNKGILININIATDKSKIWAIMQIESESELMMYINSLPLSKYCDYDYKEIVYHDIAEIISEISWN